MATRNIRTRFESEGAEKLAANFDKVSAAGAKLEHSSAGVAEALKKTNAAGEGLIPTARKLPKELQAIDNALQRVSDRGKALPRDLNAINFALNRMRASAEPVPGHLRLVNAGMTGVQATAVGLSGRLGAVGTALTALGPTGVAVAAASAGVGIIAAGLLVAVKRSAEWADRLDDEAKQVNVNVERYQSLVIAGKAVGVSQEAMTGGLQKLSAKLGETQRGGSKFYERLQEIDKGLASAFRGATDTGDALDIFSQLVSRAGSESQQTSLVLAGMGKSAGALAPLLRENAKELHTLEAVARTSGAVVEEALIKKGAEAAAKMDVLAATIEGNTNRVLLEFGDELAGIITKATDFVIKIGAATRALLEFLGVADKSNPTLQAENAQSQRLQKNILRNIDPEAPGAALRRETAIKRLRELREQDAKLDAEAKRISAPPPPRPAPRATREDGGGGTGAKKEADERIKQAERVADALRKLEDDRLRVGLEGIDLIKEEERQRFVELEQLLKENNATEADYAKLRENIAAETAARITAFEAKEQDKRDREAEKAAEQAQRELEKRAEEQARVLEGIATDLTGVLAEGLIGSFKTGKEAAFDWGEAVSDIIKKLAIDLTQALLIQGVVAPLLGGNAGGGAQGAGGGILSLLVGGGGGGSLVTTGASLLTGSGGNSSGGLLGALFGGGGGGAASGTSDGFLSSLFGGGGGGIASTPTFGAPSLLQQSLGLFGDSAGALGGVGASAGSAFGSQFLTQAPGTGVLIGGSGVDVFTQAAGSGVLLPEGATAGGSAASGASVLAAYAGLAISLGLAAKGLIDSRKQLDAATLGTGNSSKNALTGLGAGLVVGGVAAGAAIGTAVYPGLGTVVGAGVGAAVGSAISNAINSGVAAGTTTAVKAGLDQAGLEKAVAKKTGDDIILNILSGYANKVFIADILGPAFSPSIEKIFAKVFRQSIGGPGGLDTDGVTGEGNYGLGANRGQAGQAARIIAQAFGAGGDAFGTNREGRFVSLLLGGIRKRLTKEGLSDDAAYREIAEVFAGAFNGKLLNAFDAAFKGRAAQRPDDLKFIAEQFAAGAPSYGFDYQALAADVLESGRVPGKPARRQSREVIGQALAAGIENPADPRAFARSAQGGFIGVATEAFSKALASSSLGVGLAEVFAPDKNDRKALRRAKKAGDAEVADVLAAQFSKSVGKFVERISDPAYPKAIAAFSDELFKLGIALSEATGDTAGARAQLDERLAPFRAQVDAIDQAGRDVRSRSAFALAGPGFAGTEAQIAELTRQRQDAERDLRNSAVLDIGAGSINAGLAGLSGVKPGDIGIAATEVQAYAQARLSELEAQIALQRQIVDLLEQATDALRGMRGQAEVVLGTFDGRAEAARTFGLAQSSFAAAQAKGYQDPVTLQKFLGSLSTAIATSANRFQFLDQSAQGFTGLADQLALQAGGRRVGRRQLAARRAELEGLVPVALAGGRGSDDAIGRLSRLLPEVLQLGQSVLSPGQLRRLQKQIGGTASQLGIGIGNEADVAKDQLTALEKIAAQAEIGSGSALDLANVKLDALKTELTAFRDAAGPAFTYLGGVARTQLAGQLEEMIRLLGPGSPQIPYLQGIAAHFGVAPIVDPTAYDPARGARDPGVPWEGVQFRATGGSVTAGQPYWVGERAPELYVPERNGHIYTAEQLRASQPAAGGTTIHTGPIHVHIAPPPPGTPPAQASLYYRTAGDQAGAAFIERVRRFKDVA